MEMKVPFQEKKFFVVIDEYFYGKKYEPKKAIFDSYSKAMQNKSTRTHLITDSFIRAFDNLETAKAFIGIEEGA